MNWKWLQIVALKQRGCFAPQGVPFLRREEGLKEAIKELSNGISNVSLPLKKMAKKHLLCIFHSLAAHLSSKLSVCPLVWGISPFFLKKRSMLTVNILLPHWIMDLNHLTQPSDLMSELLLTQPEIWFYVSQGHFLTTFVYILVKLGLASQLF